MILLYPYIVQNSRQVLYTEYNQVFLLQNFFSFLLWMESIRGTRFWRTAFRKGSMSIQDDHIVLILLVYVFLTVFSSGETTRKEWQRATKREGIRVVTGTEMNDTVSIFILTEGHVVRQRGRSFISIGFLSCSHRMMFESILILFIITLIKVMNMIFIIQGIKMRNGGRIITSLRDSRWWSAGEEYIRIFIDCFGDIIQISQREGIGPNRTIDF